VKTFLEMDSHEEKIAEMIEKNKQREAKEEAKRRQTQIEKERSEAAKSGYG
jgi:coatomer subunit delta